jgi:hypothetical protein
MTMSIKKGKTFSRVLRPTAPPYIYRAITAITKTAPVGIKAVGHGLVTGQYAAVVSAKGMKEINAEVDRNGSPKLSEYHKVTVVDVDNITINDINAADFSAYTSGGYLQFLTPVDMAGSTARRTIKNRVGGTTLLSLTTANGGLVIDNVNHTITEKISATDTAAITWKTGVTDLELEVTATGVVTELDSEDVVVVVEEVTT